MPIVFLFHKFRHIFKLLNESMILEQKKPVSSAPTSSKIAPDCQSCCFHPPIILQVFCFVFERKIFQTTAATGKTLAIIQERSRWCWNIFSLLDKIVTIKHVWDFCRYCKIGVSRMGTTNQNYSVFFLESTIKIKNVPKGIIVTRSVQESSLISELRK